MGNARTATAIMEWKAEPLIARASHPMVINWSHWAALAKRLPANRYL